MEKGPKRGVAVEHTDNPQSIAVKTGRQTTEGYIPGEVFGATRRKLDTIGNALKDATELPYEILCALSDAALSLHYQINARKIPAGDNSETERLMRRAKFELDQR